MTTESHGLTAKMESLAHKNNLTVTWEFIPFARSRNKSEEMKSLNWTFRAARNGRKILEGYYSAGQAHCPAYAKRPGRGAHINHWKKAVSDECESGLIHRPPSHPEGAWIKTAEPVPSPRLAELLFSLALDSDVLHYTSFEDWATDMGIDTDSRRGEKAYRECLATALALRNSMGDGDFSELRELAAQY